mmetsp:Transcript_1759/g.3884  ORF Transcript_1759/g.3884 Transcript_1759/m.3884 type:complete len:420 (+) Transcript_1759:208-1467(+)
MPPPPKEAFEAATRASDVQKNSDEGDVEALGLPSALEGVPVLCSDEIVVGSELGRGGFCTVSAVRRVDFTPDVPCDKELVLTQTEVETRRRLAHSFRGYEKAHYSHRRVPGQPQPMADPTDQKPPRIALKRLKSSLNKQRYEIGLKDLTSEVTLLASLGNSHPNVISLHAIGFNDPSSRRISFAVLDQLRSTLKNKLYMWREARGLGLFITRQTLNDLWLERMVVLQRVASAVEFLHSRGVIHRDLNVDNIGFDSDDVVRVFDFGLARKVGENRLHVQGSDSSPDGGNGNYDQDKTFDMTANTGTLRYMSPEIALGFPYGLKADVYSLSILMYQVLSLHQPFVNVQPSAFQSVVIVNGFRPPIDVSWPAELKDLLQRMWAPASVNRPPAREIVDTLERLLRGSDDELYPKAALQKLLSR